jgi:hypothetical protein
MKKIFILFFIAIGLSGSAQFYNKWEISGGIKIDFSPSTPTLSLGGSVAASHPDCSSTISDALGNLLFYTDGVSVWNKNNGVMPNGTGLVGSYTGGQCAVIVPMPCSPNQYVIFHVTDFANPGYLNYTVVDMSLNGGLGDVVVSQKNIALGGSGWTEKLCAIYSPNLNAYWVVSHRWGNDQYVAFKVDASSIATTSVVSSIGSSHTCGSLGSAHDAMGQLTISQDGMKVVNALTCQDKFEMFDFNINTGVLSNSVAISGNGGNAWGTAFSPDSKKLYVNSIFGQTIFQYDLTTYSSAAINASKFTVYTTGVGGYNYGYIELGPDGKIYIPRPNSNTFIAAVNNPNNAGAACNYTHSAFNTGTSTLQHGISRAAYNIPLSSICSGINEVSNSNSGLNIFPNPANDKLNINLDQSIDQITFTNSLGQEVMSTTMQDNNSKNSIHIKELNTGIYFVSFYSEGKKIAVKKLIKE